VFETVSDDRLCPCTRRGPGRFRYKDQRIILLPAAAVPLISMCDIEILGRERQVRSVAKAWYEENIPLAEQRYQRWLDGEYGTERT
jgi:hypothetical protein